MTDEQAYETVFLIGSKVDSYGFPLLRLTASPVKLTNEGEIRNFQDDSVIDGEPLADLIVTALLDRTTTNGETYGWRVEYRDVFSVDLRRAEGMVKMLRKVERGLAKIQTELGYPESFPSYLARVAKVLGIKQFGWRMGGDDSLYSNNEYRWTDADGMAYRINDLCRKFLEPAREGASS